MKVLVAGLAKCGTRTICHALNEIGVNAYHSEDAVQRVEDDQMISDIKCFWDPKLCAGFPLPALVGLRERGLGRNVHLLFERLLRLSLQLHSGHGQVRAQKSQYSSFLGPGKAAGWQVLQL